MEHIAFHTILVAFGEVSSQPGFQNLVILLEGWILAGMRALMSTALAARAAFPEHYVTHYRFFSEGACCAHA